jgi:hypothetical protein
MRLKMEMLAEPSCMKGVISSAPWG